MTIKYDPETTGTRLNTLTFLGVHIEKGRNRDVKCLRKNSGKKRGNKPYKSKLTKKNKLILKTG